MGTYRYSEWDESQDLFDLDAEELMDELGRNLMSCGSVSDSLRQMQIDGIRDSQGRRLPGIQEWLQQIRKEKQSQLEEYGRPSMTDGTNRELNSVPKTEPPGTQAMAVKPTEMLQKLDRLEAQLKHAERSCYLGFVGEQILRELIGDKASEQLEKLRQIPETLDEAGYIRSRKDKLELTPRGMRKIGQEALEDIFAQLRKGSLGGHNINLRGAGGERIEETKKYEFGDDFQIHLQRTIMNSLYREPRIPPIRLDAEDFEVFQTESLMRSATVLMLDLSFSMPARGHFQAAKRVAIALDSLIRSHYPKDTLYIVGFSSYARRIRKEDLAYMSWDEFDSYTNIQHGLYIARKLLAKETCPNKQIILVSDGEPTAHFEGDCVFSQQASPSPRTLQLTLREARNCAKKGIVINIFMLERDLFLSAFVTQMAQINKGRVFFTSPDNLGQYLLVDYISHKKRKTEIWSGRFTNEQFGLAREHPVPINLY